MILIEGFLNYLALVLLLESIFHGRQSISARSGRLCNLFGYRLLEHVNGDFLFAQQIIKTHFRLL